MTTRYELGVKGMMCMSCANKVRTKLQAINNISDILVNIIADKVAFTTSSQEALGDVLELFKDLKYPVTYQKAHNLNTSEDQRTLALLISIPERSQIEELFAARNEQISFSDNVLEVVYNSNFTRGEEIIKLFNEKQISYKIVVKELNTQKTSDFKETFGFSETVISFAVNLIVTFLTFGLPPLISHEAMTFPYSFGVFSIYMLTIIGLSSFIVFRYGTRLIKMAYCNFRDHRSLNMFTLIALGVLSAYSLGVFFIIEGTFKIVSGSSTLEDRMMSIHTISEMMQTSATILAAVMFGKNLEERAKKAINREISSLEPRMQDHLKEVELYIPKNKKFDSLETRQVHPYLIEQEDYICIKAGNLVPFDGVLVNGEINILENIKYGRDVEETKKAGDLLTSGSEVLSGQAIMQVNVVMERSMLFKLYSQIHESSTRVLPNEQRSNFLNKVIKYFIPGVIFTSIITLIIWLVAILSGSLDRHNFKPVYAFERAISVLVASCPCALGLAIPIVFAVGLNKALKQGVLIKDGNFLLLANEINCILLDKTGTITGKFNVRESEVLGQREEVLLWQIVKAIEKEFITHPIAASLYQESVKKLSQLKGKPTGFQASLLKDNVKYCPAEGLVAEKIYLEGEDVEILLGNDNLILNRGLQLPPINFKKDTAQSSEELERKDTEGTEPESSGNIWLFIGGKPELRISIDHKSSLRGEVNALINFFKHSNKDVYLVTGDGRESALEAAQQLGLEPEYVKFESEPQHKRDFILSLKQSGQKVMMVGDGLNDLMAFQAADLSVAINYKSEKNLAAADVILLNNDILKLATLINLSKWSERIKNMSLFFAFCYNVVLIPSAVGVFYFTFHYELPPSQACWAMAISSLVVLAISNSLRLVPIEFNAEKFKQQNSRRSRKISGAFKWRKDSHFKLPEEGFPASKDTNNIELIQTVVA